MRITKQKVLLAAQTILLVRKIDEFILCSLHSVAGSSTATAKFLEDATTSMSTAECCKLYQKHGMSSETADELLELDILREELMDQFDALMGIHETGYVMQNLALDRIHSVVSSLQKADLAALQVEAFYREGIFQ